jgi:cation diffusion facilitator family transporter
MSKTKNKSDLYEATKVTLIGALLDLVLGILKIVTGLITNSFALVSDGVHSLSDLLTDGFVLIISKISHAEPDRDHPYGHRRFETLGTIALGIVLFSVACIIAYDSIRRLSQDEVLPVPGWTGLLVAALSIISKEWIYRYTKKVADMTNSSLLLANAWHSRTDALSSIAVFIGIFGAILGYPVMDILAAIFVALIIAKIAWDLVSSSLRELVDTALPEQQLQAITSHVNNLEGIEDVHDLRTRLHGGQTFVDLHVQVDSRISVSEGHYLADHISGSLKQAFPEISDIVVHIDPELDTDHSHHPGLPMRADVEKTLLSRWQQVLQKDDLQRLELHYLDEKIEAEIYINISLLNKELTSNLESLVEDVEWLEKVTFYGIV